MPTVEPMLLKAVPQDAAKTMNAAVAFTRSAVPPAIPFRISGDIATIDRATDCLASALYYEAGAETVSGQMAVAQVILNRVRHPAYPKTVCGVVYQGQERTTGCQFSFTCDGSMARIPGASAWDRLRVLARTMLGGKVYAPVGWATHYHTDWVVPIWSAKLDKVRAEGTHLFFRWNGYWGTPRAFRGGYASSEPVVPRLSRLSLAHAGAGATLDSLAFANQSAGEIEGKVILSGGNGEFIVEIDRSVDPSLLPILAQRTCGDRPYCKLIAWTNSALMPTSFPVGEAQFSTASFSFLRNRGQNFEKPLWNCAQFPRDDRKQCMRRRVMIEGKPQELIPTEAEPLVPTTAATSDDKQSNPSAIPTVTERRRPGAGN